ncbi:unnamed protein product, partial [Musa textilis]
HYNIHSNCKILNLLSFAFFASFEIVILCLSLCCKIAIVGSVHDSKFFHCNDRASKFFIQVCKLAILLCDAQASNISFSCNTQASKLTPPLFLSKRREGI